MEVTKKYTMKDYIEETPIVLYDHLKNYKELTQPFMDQVSMDPHGTIWLIASGSSYHACMCAYPYVKACCSQEIKMLNPFTFCYYEHDVKEHDTAIVITQSGLSTNAIDAIKKLKQIGRTAICLTGNRHSDVKEYADVVLEYGVGEELVGYVTKGVSTLCLYLMLIGLRIAQKTNDLEMFKQALKAHVQVKEHSYSFIEKHYQALTAMNCVYCCGGGGTRGVAMEAALKIGETIHIPSIYYEVEEFIHGPNLQLTPNYTVLFFDTNDAASDRIIQIYQATRAVSDHAFLLTNRKELQEDNHVFYINTAVPNEVLSLVYLPFVQLLSFLVSQDLHSVIQHPLLKKFKQIAAAKTENFINYDEDDA